MDQQREPFVRIGAAKIFWCNLVALPLLGRHLARGPHRPGVQLLSGTYLIREPCFLSPCVLGPPLGPFEPPTGLQGIRLCSLEIHQLHLAAAIQIITHATPLPTCCEINCATKRQNEKDSNPDDSRIGQSCPHRLAIYEIYSAPRPAFRGAANPASWLLHFADVDS
jgi:hypothetical protein